MLIKAHIPYIFACHPQIDSNPDPTHHCHADSDPDPHQADHFDADSDPDPTFQTDAGPCGSGSATLRHKYIWFLHLYNVQW